MHRAPNPDSSWGKRYTYRCGYCGSSIRGVPLDDPRLSEWQKEEIVYSTPPDLFTEYSPAIIRSGTLFKNLDNGLHTVSLDVQNIQDNPIKQATVEIELHRRSGGLLRGAPLSFLYPGNRVKRGERIGGRNTRIPLKAAPGLIKVRIRRVDFADGETWIPMGDEWRSVAPNTIDYPVPLELEQMYGLEPGHANGRDGQFGTIYTDCSDIWWCSCGAINHVSESKCYQCGQERAALEKVDWVALRDAAAKLHAHPKKKPQVPPQQHAQTERKGFFARLKSRSGSRGTQKNEQPEEENSGPC